MTKDTPDIILTLGIRFGGEDYQPEDQPIVRALIREHLNLQHGDLLIAGASFGFDAAVADVVLEDNLLADTLFVAPFKNFHAHWPTQSDPYKTFGLGVLPAAPRVLYASEEYYGGVYTARDHLALRTALKAKEDAPFVTHLRAITFWDGRRGALQDSLLDLLAVGAEIINLHPAFLERREQALPGDNDEPQEYP